MNNGERDGEAETEDGGKAIVSGLKPWKELKRGASSSFNEPIVNHKRTLWIKSALLKIPNLEIGQSQIEAHPWIEKEFTFCRKHNGKDKEQSSTHTNPDYTELLNWSPHESQWLVERFFFKSPECSFSSFSLSHFRGKETRPTDAKLWHW